MRSISRRLILLIAAIGTPLHAAWSGDRIASTDGNPAPPAPPELARQFEHWRVMYSRPGQPILATVTDSGAKERGCFEGDAKPIAGRAWYQGRPTRETPLGPLIQTDLYQSDSAVLRQRLFEHERILTVLSATGKTSTVTFNAVDSHSLRDQRYTREYCYYYTIADADGFTDPHASPFVGKDDELGRDKLETVAVTDEAPSRPISARPIVSRASYYPPSERHPPPGARPMPKTMTTLLRRKDVSRFLRADRPADSPIDYSRDLKDVYVQQLDIALDPRRPRDRVWFVLCTWSNNDYLKFWGMFRATPRGYGAPLYMWKSYSIGGEEGPSGLFGFEFSADLNGDGVEEIIAHREIFEGFGDAILAWDRGSPVVVYEGNIFP